MEIQTTGLPKKILKKLDDISAYATSYKLAKGEPPESVHMAAPDFDSLMEGLRNADKTFVGQSPTYHGVLLLRASR